MNSYSFYYKGKLYEGVNSLWRVSKITGISCGNLSYRMTHMGLGIQGAIEYVKPSNIYTVLIHGKEYTGTLGELSSIAGVQESTVISRMKGSKHLTLEESLNKSTPRNRSSRRFNVCLRGVDGSYSLTDVAISLGIGNIYHLNLDSDTDVQSLIDKKERIVVSVVVDGVRYSGSYTKLVQEVSNSVLKLDLDELLLSQRIRVLKWDLVRALTTPRRDKRA